MSVGSSIFGPHVSADRTREWRDRGLHAGETLGRAMASGVERRPDGVIHYWSDGCVASVHLGSLAQRGRRLAGALHALGLRAGDVAVSQIPNSPENSVFWYAGCLLGLVLVPVVTIYGAAELGYIIRDSGARLLVLPDRWGKVNFLQRVVDMGACPDLHHLVVIGDDVPPGAMRWEDLDEGPELSFPANAGAADDPAVLLYTSGTTAEPKCVAHSADTLLAELRLNARYLKREDDIFFNPSPSGHVTGVLQTTQPFALSAASTVMMDRWNAEAGVELIDRYGATASATTPTFLATALDVAERTTGAMRSMKSWMVGGAGVPPTLIERADDLGIRAYRSFGSTEHPTVTVGHPDDELRSRARTDGRPVSGTLLRIVDDTGTVLPVGEEGEILTTGPDQMMGYTDPQKQAQSFSRDGFLRTGDIGVLDGRGMLTVTDRQKDIIIRGGENLSSREIEDVLSRHPSVAEAAVVAMPDERYGEKVCAFVIVRGRDQLTLPGVAQLFEEAGVARQKTPERLEVVPELPRTPSGKVKKKELRDRLVGDGE